MKSILSALLLLLVVVLGLLSAVRAEPLQETDKVTKPLADNYCPLCEAVVSYVEAWLASNATETEIINGVNSVCNLAPAYFAAKCDTFVDQWIVYIINQIVQHEGGPQLCTQITACPGPSNAVAQEPTTNNAITVLE